MPELLLLDVALCVLLVMLAGCVMMVRRRRRRNQAAARAGEGQGTAAELTGNGMVRRETAVVPGFGEYPAEPDLDGSAPAEPEHAARSQVSRATGPPPDPDGPRAERNGARAGPDGARARPDGPRAERNGARAGPDGARAGPDTPGAAPNGQPAAAGAATASDPIGSYYDEADRAMSDYLAALGWTEEPGTRHTG
jgi:hypothetical protein